MVDEPSRETNPEQPEKPNEAQASSPTKASKPTEAAGEKPASSGRPAANAGSGAVAIEVAEREGVLRRFLRAMIHQTPSWLVSTVVHVVVLLLLALLTMPPPPTDDAGELVVTPDEEEELEEIDAFEEEPLEEIDVETVTDMVFESQVEQEVIDVSPFDDLEAAAVSVELSDVGLDLAPKSDLLNQVGAFRGNALEGRGSGKARLVARGGGSDASERAVALALEWLAKHQMPDGGWNFNHAVHPECRGQCRNPGELAQARNAATGMALLPFLGAGQTHEKGKYKEAVRKGLYFLVSRMKVSPQGGSLFEDGGRMYSHGICSIALCEAYAMTHDKRLYAPAQQALNFIAYAQDPVGGGWRYTPRQPGDTSVVGWQIMALKSGHMAYLRVPPITVKKASLFLDTVQSNNGANYGYTDPGKGAATSAIGLLCRMYLGWKKENPALERGTKWLGDRGPSSNMYYNYYATQVMHHVEGDPWKNWNAVMRDQLVQSQAKKGHETGSWYVTGDRHGDRGGRLYSTAMATMVLEVYYRHLPIYRKQSTEEDFPLD